MATPYSDFTVSDIINDLSKNQDFNSLSLEQKIKLIDLSQQEIGNLSMLFGSKWYRDTTVPYGNVPLQEVMMLIQQSAFGDDPSVSVKAMPTAVLFNSIYSYFSVDVNVPPGASSVSGITVYIKRTSTGNLKLRFNTMAVSLGVSPSVPTTDADLYSLYNVSSGDGKVEGISVPSAAFDGLGVISSNMAIGLAIERDAVDPTDTYESDLEIVSVRFEFN